MNRTLLLACFVFLFVGERSVRAGDSIDLDSSLGSLGYGQFGLGWTSELSSSWSLSSNFKYTRSTDTSNTRGLTLSSSGKVSEQESLSFVLDVSLNSLGDRSIVIGGTYRHQLDVGDGLGLKAGLDLNFYSETDPVSISYRQPDLVLGADQSFLSGDLTLSASYTFYLAPKSSLQRATGLGKNAQKGLQNAGGLRSLMDGSWSVGLDGSFWTDYSAGVGFSRSTAYSDSESTAAWNFTFARSWSPAFRTEISLNSSQYASDGSVVIGGLGLTIGI